MADDHFIAVQAGPGGAAGGAPAKEGMQLLTPHRRRAVLCLSLGGACCFAIAVIAGLLIRTGSVVTQEPEGELLLIVGIIAMAGHLALSLAAWAMAANDLRRMADGRMDPAGKGGTVVGKVIAMVFVLATIAFAIAAIILVLSDRAAFTLDAPLEEA